MTNEKLREIAQFYEEINKTAELIIFLKDCNSFYLSSGSQQMIVPSGLQSKIKRHIVEYYKELREKQKEL